MMENKICSKCEELKSTSEFHRDNHLKSGFRSSCKECTKVTEVTRTWRRNNKERRRKYLNEYMRVYKKKHPKKVKARALANTNAHIVKGSCCEQCQSLKDLQMHHEDYDKPLEVVTLCVPCHRKIHNEG